MIIDKDLNIIQDNVRFNFRVGVALIHEGKILLQNHSDCDFWNLPGGRVKFGEDTLSAIKREVKEELLIDVDNLKLVDISENFFMWDDKYVQELLFIYTTELSSNNVLTQKQDFHSADKPEETCHWFDFEEIQNLKCLPELIYTLNLGDTIKHEILKK